jgi:hypothetical protein
MQNDYNKYTDVEKCENVEKNVEKNVEISPIKVFSINKTDKEIENYPTETPAKDENMYTEAEIFETPSISKVIDPLMNLNTKISHLIMLKEEESKKNSKINIDHVSSKFITKSPIQLLKALPPDIQIKALEIKKCKNTSMAIQKIKMEKSEEEVAKAVESIIIDEEKKMNKNYDTSVESIVLDSSSTNNDIKSIANKFELVKAIESITKADYESQEYSLFKSTNLNDESDNEANLELVLEDENIPADISNIEDNQTKEKFIQNNNNSPHQHNTRFKSRKIISDEKNLSISNSNGLSNCNIPCQEIQYVFDEDNYKRRRRKAFSDAELTWEFQDEIGNLMNATAPTPLDIIFQINPTRKKTLKQAKAVKREKFVLAEDITQDSIPNRINNNNSVSNAKSISNDKKGKKNASLLLFF